MAVEPTDAVPMAQHTRVARVATYFAAIVCRQVENQGRDLEDLIAHAPPDVRNDVATLVNFYRENR